MLNVPTTLLPETPASSRRCLNDTRRDRTITGRKYSLDASELCRTLTLVGRRYGAANAGASISIQDIRCSDLPLITT
jgi:hypothetical protein